MAASVNTDPAPSTSLVSKPVLCFLIVDGKEEGRKCLGK